MAEAHPSKPLREALSDSGVQTGLSRQAGYVENKPTGPLRVRS